jgi:hypothetical protein
LSSPDDAVVLASLDLLETFDRARLVPPLILYHPSPRVVVRALGVFERTGRGAAIVSLAPRVRRHPSADVRAALLRVPDLTPDEATLREMLHHDPEPVVRRAALSAWVERRKAEPEEIEKEILALLQDSSREAGLTLAGAIGVLPAHLEVRVAESLREHSDASIALALARNLAEHPRREHIPLCIELLASPDTRPAARQALRALGAPALEALGAALARPETPAAVRRHVPRTLSRFASAEAAAVLANALDHPDPQVAYKILRGLGRMCTEDPDLPVPREPVVAYTERSLVRCVQQLAARCALELEAELTSARWLGLLVELLRDMELRELERAFRGLHILEPHADHHATFEALRSGDADWGARAREVLELEMEGPIRAGFLGLATVGSPAERLEELRAFHEPPDGDALLDAARALASVGEGDKPQPLRVEVARLAEAAQRRLQEDGDPAISALASFAAAWRNAGRTTDGAA